MITDAVLQRIARIDSLGGAVWGSISDIAVINPETTGSDWNGREIHYIDIASVGSGVFKSKPQVMLYDEAPSRARRVVKHGDVLISTVRPNRRSMIQILNPEENTVASTGFALLRPKRIEDSDYLFGIICNKQFTLELEMLAYGAAYPAVSTDDICRPAVYLPKEQERDRISNLLRPISRLNQSKLAEIMQKYISALFRSWFIDFDPVKAKAGGKLPHGMDEETAVLFPNSFETSKYGPIPAGWDYVFLEELATLTTRTINPKKEPKKEFFHYSIPAYDDGVKPIPTLGDDIESNKFVVPENCVLLSKLNPRWNRVWLPGSSIDHMGIASTEFLPWVPKNGISVYYLHSLMVSQPFRWLMDSRISGTTGSHQRVRPDDCAKIPCLMPSLDVMRKFHDVVTGMFEVMNNFHKTKINLVNTIDGLLPKLMSSKLGVSEEL